MSRCSAELDDFFGVIASTCSCRFFSMNVFILARAFLAAVAAAWRRRTRHRQGGGWNKGRIKHSWGGGGQEEGRRRAGGGGGQEGRARVGTRGGGQEGRWEVGRGGEVVMMAGG